MSRLFYLGHDGFLLEDNDFSLVMDYWDLDNKAFQGYWKRSENIELTKEIRETVYNSKYVWVSHEHTDHFDPIYIKKLREGTTLLLPKFVDDFFINELYKLNLKCQIKVLEPYRWIKLDNSLNVKVILEQPEYTCHASLLIQNNKSLILHNGDTTITPKFLEYIENPSIDYFLGQYTPPTPYPWTNEDMKDTEKNNIFDSVLESQLQHFADSCKSLSVKYAIPCAGPAEVKSDIAKSTSYSRKKLFNKVGLLGNLTKKLENTKIINLSVNDEIFNFQR